MLTKGPMSMEASYEGDLTDCLGLLSPDSSPTRSLRSPAITRHGRHSHTLAEDLAALHGSQDLLWLVPSLTLVVLAGGKDQALPAPTGEAGDHPAAWP